ncbi:hypothetical protein [Shewanella livingstonensis]|uniref:Uncharacterized protein n=1 Tax=Shewanella livingstonensis TaxID=150120 RepID=A0A3G8LQ82_9GAMM|nr:hypothetical protein [Shewanella livingstonensis]AZG71679.1 hypothetical protein EGC82_02200 [Shewanella livingstonensis]
MKYKKVVIIISLLIVVAGYGIYSYTAESTLTFSPPVVASAPVDVLSVQPKAVKQMKPKQITVVEKIPQPISDSFQLMAEAYASELTLPSYSIPLTTDDSHLLNPNAYIPQSVLLQDGASASIILSKYRFSFPEPVVIKLDVKGLQINGASAALRSELNDEAETLISTAMLGADGEWAIQLNAEEDWNGPMEVSVTFRAKGKKQILKTGIEYSHPTATITGVEEIRAEGSDMLIPVKLDVERAGYYRLRANLYSVDKQPIALLTGSEKLAEGSVVMDLKAYKGVLTQHKGPYVLRTFVLERRPAVPGELTQYGHSEEPAYKLGDFAVESLSDEPWQPDEQEMQRLEFLQKMAGD